MSDAKTTDDSLQQENAISMNEEDLNVPQTNDQSIENDNMKIVKENTDVHKKSKLLNDNFSYQISVGFLENSTMFEELGVIRFKDQIIEQSLCDCCSFILWNPVKLDCSHCICRKCVLFSESGESEVIVECPIDLSVSSSIKDDTDLQDYIAELNIHCIEIECDWIGKLCDFEKHFEGCIHKKIICSNCSELVPLINAEEHVNNTCPCRPVSCSHCSASIQWQDLQKHEDTCPEKLVSCPNGCKVEDSEEVTLIKQSDLECHINTKCIERKVSCPFAEFGCDKVTRWKRMNNHFVKFSIFHLSKMCDFGKVNRDSLEKQTISLFNIQNKLVSKEKICNILKEKHGPQLLMRISDVSEKINNCISGKSAEVASTYLYSTKYGYKLHLKLILTGSNDSAGGRFVSVLIALCDNDYNAILKWPFQQTIDFHLINQVSKNHISQSVVPNPLKENFPFIQRPKNQRNPYFGIEKFTKLSTIDGETNFVVNNTMFLRVIVQPHDTV